MKTFKVTFFDRYDIFNVVTFHNVINQSAFVENVASQIVSLELAPVVRCEAEGNDYTDAMNSCLKYDIDEIEKGYAKKYFEKLDIL